MNVRLLKQKIRSQLGFTLLELLVVIAVIGVLASLAVPRLQNQIQKARFVEVVSAVAPFKTAVETCFQRNNSLDPCGANGVEGIPVAATASASGAVTAVTVGENGVITAEAGAAFGNGVTYTLTPVDPGGASASGLSWTVGGTCLAQALCNQ